MIYDIFTAFIVFKITWWLVFYCMLPVTFSSAQTDQTDNCNPQGCASSAPANPFLKKKIIITTLITLIIWSVIEAIIHLDVIKINVPDLMDFLK